MRYLYLFILPLCLFIITACSDDDNPASSEKPQTYSNGQSLMPLSVGNQWIMKSTMYLADTVFSVSYDTLRITETFVYDDSEWFDTNMSTVTRMEAFRMTYSGLELRDNETVIRFKYPALLGEREVFQTTDDPLEVTVVHVDTLVTTQVGEFHCVKYSAGNTEEIEKYFFISPGVGIVRVETVKSYHFIDELIAYEIQ